MATAEHKNIWAALLAFKAEAPTLPKDKVNPHFKSRYTPLDTIGEKIDPLLTKHGLVWVALPGHNDGHPVLDYQLAHAPSGEVLSGQMVLLLDRENSQGLGSALTYCRRYAKVAVLDLVADEDDDGNAASRPAQHQKAGSQPNGGDAYVTPADIKALQSAAKGLDAEKVKLALTACGIPIPEPLVWNKVPKAKALILAEALAAVER